MSQEKPDNPPKKKWEFDLEKYKFPLSATAIIALIIAVYTLTSFVFRKYHDVDKRIIDIKKELEIQQVKFDYLKKDFERTDNQNSKVSDKLEKIEENIGGLEKQLEDGK